jgi:hypothetical protein
VRPLRLRRVEKERLSLTDTPIDEAQLKQMLVELDDIEARARLHPVEVEIVEGLKRRPIKHWCAGCFKMISAIYQKAKEARQ